MAFCKSDRISKVISIDGDTVIIEHTGRTHFGPENGQTTDDFLKMWPVGASWNTGGPDVGDHINTELSNDGKTCVIEHSGHSRTTAHVNDGPWKVGEFFGFDYERAPGKQTEIRPIDGQIQ